MNWNPARLALLGSPARAGMDLARNRCISKYCRLPRTRGDGPPQFQNYGRMYQAPPHARGWTVRCSVDKLTDKGSPARAGMDPHKVV